MYPFEFKLDPKHESFPLFEGQLTNDVWRNKYRYKDEANIQQTFARVADAMFHGYSASTQEDYRAAAYRAMSKGLLMPAGRILAGAGTGKRVTLMNCYVSRTIPDSLDGIFDALKEAALTMQQGGGIGMDFSTLRPKGAKLFQTDTEASGPLYFMDTWDAMCSTIMSAGSRRGAMMGTICDTHPDLLEFITAKQTRGRLTNFNVSILVSDAFMEAVREDAEWVLYFEKPPYYPRSPELEAHDFMDNGRIQYAYSVHRARDLWEKITQNTYKYSEPGVIFIDRVNELNNLSYMEDIRCTNPCGEQPLPPYAACNLGAINLARIVRNPHTEDAEIDFNLLEETVKIGVRFLDSVIDVCNYPLRQQHEEQKNKRRIGLGISGLADMLGQLQIKYGSPRAVREAENVMKFIATSAYYESVEMAKELGAFPAYKSAHYLEAPFIKKLPQGLQNRIAEHGIRNSLLLTIAPTGTTSIVYGNVSSGLEPVFAHSSTRKVRSTLVDNKDKWDTYTEWGFGARFYWHCVKDDKLPEYMNTSETLSVEQHIKMQGACQKWVDASVSKTINCPESITYEEFAHVYDLAYDAGCKGCTTYRPNPEVRGEILSTGKPQAPKDPRGEVLDGHTYRIKWSNLSASIFVTLNHRDNQPYECFINSKDQRHGEWISALTLMISMLLRNGIPLSSIAEELKQVVSMNNSAWQNGKYYPSLVSRIGHTLLQHSTPQNTSEPATYGGESNGLPQLGSAGFGRICPDCQAPALQSKGGCLTCGNCGASKCE